MSISGPVEAETVVVGAFVTGEPLDHARAVAAVQEARTGAVVSFSGVIRDHDGGRGVTSLDYTCHPSAGEVIQAVAQAVAEQFPGVRIWAAHRVGHLQIGDSALEAAVAAAHRRLAFAACAALVDRIKTEVPIWKEQRFTDGSTEWVGLDA
ncbi:molybdenum cofactor biosynthesis protein MoaE [Kocuria rosea]|jgi:molybdopterin synthase catalytic subunit|uniref:molybdenum cofactor biosynthesis protein MoaE n=1 Tax=Kocuria rosea TaxID=1275 RepID=UPI00203DD9DB|nr:molybdenum cofactor biosynthesis protein MoaE [Kocuria rosea]MCM3689070.1 molybdenum cofactor biosynthesis protein MoaE [Kocuria rosea]